MSEVSVNITMDEGMMNSFADFCKDIGLSMSSAV